MSVLIYFLTPIAYGLADRGIGGGFQRSIVVAVMLICALGLGAVAGYPFAGLLMACWLAYRTAPWSVGGTITPRGPVQIGGAFLRHSAPALAVVGGNVWFGTPAIAAIPLVAYGVIATGLAVAYAAHVDKGVGDGVEENDLLEGVRGVAFGLAAVWAMVM